MEEFYEDGVGNEIAVGVKVKLDDEGSTGTVKRIDEIDVDYDDNLQQAVGYGPYVWVQWPELEDGDLERFGGYRTSSLFEDNMTFSFEDLEVVV